MGIAFGGNDTLGVLTLDDTGEGALVSFTGPAWKQAQTIRLSGLAPRVVIGHPSAPHALVAPRPAIEWGRDEAQESSMNEGFTAYDLRTGQIVGGAGPIGSVKMGIVEEETDETICWIELLVKAGLVNENDVSDLLEEANQILAMTVSSIKTARRKSKK